MAVGRGSMERAAKAAGGDTAKKSGDKAQTPRRLTISEIVGEPSYVEPPRAAKPAANREGTASEAARPAAANKAAEANLSKAVVGMTPAEKVEEAAIEKAETKVPEAPKVPDAGKTPEALKKEAEGKIVYQKSSGMLERAAEPNERFGLGDAMPVYYF